MSDSKFWWKKLKISMKIKPRYMLIYLLLKLFNRVNKRFKSGCTRWEYLKLWGMSVIGYQWRKQWISIIVFIISYQLILNHYLSKMIYLPLIDGIIFYNMLMSWNKSAYFRIMNMKDLFILIDLQNQLLLDKILNFKINWNLIITKQNKWKNRIQGINPQWK